MELVFIRHGKAGNEAPEIADSDRCLTSIGRAELKRAIPSLKYLINDQRNIRIWSSPLLRARQSAEIFADAFGVKEAEIYDFINSGEFVVLSGELEKMESNAKNDLIPLADQLIIVVGHQPTLSDWCKTICGNFIPFKKGMAVGIELFSLSPVRGKVDWIICPNIENDSECRNLFLVDFALCRKEHDPMPKINKNKPAISEIKKALLHFLQEIQIAQGRFLEDPEEAENLHQLRVNIRKYRSLLSFARPLLDPDKYRIAQERMRKSGQPFSYLRELDVLQNEWDQIISKQEMKIPDPSNISETLKNERKNEKTRLFNLLTDGILTTILLEQWTHLSDVYADSDTKTEVSLEVYTHNMINKWQKKIHKELREINASDLERIHLIRIRSKKLRYVQEIFVKKNTSHRNTRNIAAMKDLQERLGILCDIQRNIELIDRLFSKNKLHDIAFERSLFIGYLLGKEAGLHLSSCTYASKSENPSFHQQ